MQQKEKIERMQALIATDGFDGNSVSCIIDRDSNVVISPTNLDFFFALDDLFVANKDPELRGAFPAAAGKTPAEDAFLR